MGPIMPDPPATPAAAAVATFQEGGRAALRTPAKENHVEAWQAVALAVGALLVGALLPAVIQLTLALRALRTTVVRADRALVAIAATSERLDRITEGGRVESFLDALDSLSCTVTRLQDTARVATAVGAAVGPAVGAAVRAWRVSREESAPPPDGANAS